MYLNVIFFMVAMVIVGLILTLISAHSRKVEGKKAEK